MHTSVGDLVYSRFLGKDIIILNSETIAKELLENRSGNYSDRPYLVTNDLSVLHSPTVLPISVHILDAGSASTLYSYLAVIGGGCTGVFFIRLFERMQ